MQITKAYLSNGKELIFMGGKGWQRWVGAPADYFEPFDIRILDHTPLPETAQVEAIEV